MIASQRPLSYQKAPSPVQSIVVTSVARYSLLLIFVTIMTFVPSANAERTLGSYGPFTSTVADNYKCGPGVAVRIASSQSDTASTDPQFRKTAELTRVMLGFECPELHHIDIQLTHGGKQIGEYYLRKNTNWVVESVVGRQSQRSPANSPSMKQTNRSKPEAVPTPRADSNTEVVTLDPETIFRVGSMTFTRNPSQTECNDSNDARFHISHEIIDLAARKSLAGFQEEIRTFATHYEAGCPAVDTIWMVPLNQHESSNYYAVVNQVDNWLLESEKVSRAEDKRLRERVHAFIRTFRNSPTDPNHGLKTFGYHNASLIGRSQTFDLYQAVDIPEHGSYSLVVLHKVRSDDEPAFDIRYDGPNTWPSVGPGFRSELQNVFTTSGAKAFPGVELRHYFQDYFNPNSDRVAVLGPNAIEPPHFVTYMQGYWENGELTLSPYGSKLIKGRFRTRGEIIAARGPSGPEVVDDPMSIPDMGELLPEKPGEKYMARQQRILLAASTKGLIYKNDAYWSVFRARQTRHIFESYADNRAVGETAYGAILMRYLTVNSQRCTDTILDPLSFELNETTVTTSGWGGTSSSNANIYKLIVPARFKAELERRFGLRKSSDPAATISKAIESIQPGGLTRLANQLGQTQRTINRSVADVDRLMSYGKCGNPIHLQFEEMLYTRTHNRDRLKDGKLSFPDASSLSDDLYRPGQAPSLLGACVIDSEFKNDRSIRWCECMVDKITQVKPDKVSAYVKRYELYNRDVRIARIRKARAQQHPDNRLYTIQQYCAGQID